MLIWKKDRNLNLWSPYWKERIFARVSRTVSGMMPHKPLLEPPTGLVYLHFMSIVWYKI